MKRFKVIAVSAFLAGAAFGDSQKLWEEIPESPATSVVSSGDKVPTNRQDNIDTKVATQEQVGLILMGNSITHYWEGDRASYIQLTEGREALNMGVSGDVTPGMLHSMLVRGWLNLRPTAEPRVVMMLCGTNNLHRTDIPGMTGRDTPPQEVADGVRAIIQTFIRHFPTIRIINLAILPTTWHQGWEPTNAISKDYFDNRQVFSVDMKELFVNNDGSVNRDLLPDGIHPNDAGYQVWVDSVDPLIDSLFEAGPMEVISIMNLGGRVVEGLSTQTSYRRYLDGMLRRAGHHIDFTGSRSGHNNDQDHPSDHYTESPEYYQYDPDHEGNWGQTSGWTADNIGDLTADNIPDIAVLHIGTEDLLAASGSLEETVDGVVANISRTIDSLRMKNLSVKIALSQIIPTTSSDVSNPEEAVQALNTAIARMVMEKTDAVSPIVLVDQYTDFDANADLGNDDVLPNQSGALKMADKFFAVIDALIDGRGCKDEAYLEFDPSAMESDETLCKTLVTTALGPGGPGFTTRTRADQSIRIYSLTGKLVKDLHKTSRNILDADFLHGFNLRQGIYFVQRGNHPVNKTLMIR